MKKATDAVTSYLERNCVKAAEMDLYYSAKKLVDRCMELCRKNKDDKRIQEIIEQADFDTRKWLFVHGLAYACDEEFWTPEECYRRLRTMALRRAIVCATSLTLSHNR